MADRYLEFVNSTVGSSVAGRLGLPRPAVLRRYAPGDPLLPGPALLAAAAGSVAAELRGTLAAAGVDVVTDLPESVAAIVLDARSVAAPGDLAAVRDVLAPAVKVLRASGRVVVLARPPEGADVAVDATRQALDGIVRSLAKELRRGATANL
ncbi:MAG TPA: hypothetical protein VFU35_08890, partial [Jatrophihabitans sp.]|nr:hypothetical protein [Jatrophihabitans sp.]